MASPVRYTGSSPSRTGFSPRVVGRLLARLEKISKAQRESDERGDNPNNEARDGYYVKKGGCAGQGGDNHGRDHISNHGNCHVHWPDNNSFLVNTHTGDSSHRKAWPNDSQLAEKSSDKLSIHKTSQDDPSLGAPVQLRRKEEPNGHPAIATLGGLSLVKGNHPGFIEEDVYIRPAASDLEVDEDYWVKYGPAGRGALQLPTKKLPKSNQMVSPLSHARALESRCQCREKMEESGYLVRGRQVCSSNSPEHYRFVPISRFGNAKRTGEAEKNGSTEPGDDTKAWGNTMAQGDIMAQHNVKARENVKIKDSIKARGDFEARSSVKLDDYVKINLESDNYIKVKKNPKPQSSITHAKGPASHGVSNTSDKGDYDKEWDFVSTWSETEEAEALLKNPTVRGFPPSLLL